MTLWVLVLFACGSDEPATCEPPGTQLTEVRAAGCLTVLDGSLLMIQARDDRWSIPAGYVEAGEDPATAAIRETRVEGGLAVRAKRPVCAVESSGFVAFSCSAEPGAKPRPDGKETKDARFMRRADIEALALRFPEQRALYMGLVP